MVFKLLVSLKEKPFAYLRISSVWTGLSISCFIVLHSSGLASNNDARYLECVTARFIAEVVFNY